MADVLAVKRYLTDTFICQITGETASADFPYIFDILLTDGVHKRKFLLSPALNSLVCKNILRVGSTIEVKEVRPVMGHAHILLLFEISVKNLRTVAGDFPFWPYASEREKQDVPFISSRGSYLSLWNSVDPHGQPWESYSVKSLDEDEAVKFRRDRWKLENISSKHVGMKCSFVVCGRVITKSRLVHFGKPKDCGKLFPFMFNFVIQDETATIPVVAWEDMCVKLFKTIHVGDILTVQRYKVKQKYQRMISLVQSPVPQLTQAHIHKLQSLTSSTKGMIPCPLTASSQQIEISLMNNSVVRLISVAHANSLGLKILPVVYKFVQISELQHLADNIILDVMGVVTFVGQWERLRQAAEVSKTCPDLWSFRWVAINDESTTKSILLQLFACSNPMAWNAVEQGKVLVCTRCLISSSVTSSRGKPARTIFLTTTTDSQIYVAPSSIGASRRGPFCHTSRYVDVVTWSVSEEGKKSVAHGCVAGSLSFPPYPTSLQELQDKVTLELTSISSIPSILEKLHYRERCSIVIQGSIVGFKLVMPHHSQSGCYRETEGGSISEVRQSNYSQQSEMAVEKSETDSDNLQSDDTGDVEKINPSKRARLSDKYSPKSNPQSKQVTPQWTVVTDTRIESDNVSFETLPDPVISAKKPFGHWIVTVQGNTDSAVLNLIFLPVWPELEPWRSYAPVLCPDTNKDSTIIDMLALGVAPPIPVSLSECTVDIQEIGQQVEGQSFLFVVDMISYGSDNVELILRRGFPV
jgi:hypothetical protein